MSILNSHQKNIVFILCCFYFTYNCGTVLTSELKCVPIKQCTSVLNLISTKKYAPETIQLLRNSHCGYDENRLPKVWCGAPDLNFCKTPDNQNGTCVKLEECRYYLDVKSILGLSHPVVKEFSSRFRCTQVVRDELHVCCPTEQLPNTKMDKNFNLNRNNKDLGTSQTKNFILADDDYDKENELDNEFVYRNDRHNTRSRTEFYGSSDYTSSNSPHPEYKENDYINKHINNFDGTKGYGHNLYNFHNSFHNKDFNDYNFYNNRHKFFGHKYHSRHNWHRNFPIVPNWHNHGWDNNDEISTTNNYNDYTTEGLRRDFRHTRQSPDVWSTTINTTPKNFEQNTITTTAESTTINTLGRNDKNENICETPDKKPGVCKNQNNCQPYQNLLNNLDKSSEATQQYLSKFICKSTSSTQDTQICCDTDEDKGINVNSVFNPETVNKNIPEDYSKICGRQTGNTNKIYGGKTAYFGEFPWIALLEYKSSKSTRFGCGGTLINSRYVLTAAHCVDTEILKQRQLGQLNRVILGEFDTRNKTDCIYYPTGEDCADPAKPYGIESIISHNLYNSSMTRHDIALIRLDQEVVFTDYIRPICLPTNITRLNGNESFTIAGWGKTPTQTFSPVLKRARIRNVKKEDCNSRNRRSLPLIEGQICAGQGNGTDSCNGDSGGPVMLEVYNSEFITYLLGIISYGFGNCGFSPSVNTYVPFYIDWINKNIK